MARHPGVATPCLDPGLPATAGDMSGNGAELGRCGDARGVDNLTAYF